MKNFSEIFTYNFRKFQLRNKNKLQRNGNIQMTALKFSVFSNLSKFKSYNFIYILLYIFYLCLIEFCSFFNSFLVIFTHGHIFLINK